MTKEQRTKMEKSLARLQDRNHRNKQVGNPPVSRALMECHELAVKYDIWFELTDRWELSIPEDNVSLRADDINTILTYLRNFQRRK